MIKNIALVLLLLTGLSLGGLLVQEKQQTTHEAAHAAELQTEVTRQHEEIRKTAAVAAETEQKRVQTAARAKAAKQALLDARNATSAAASSAPVTDPATSPDDPAGSDPSAKTPDKVKKPTNLLSESLAKMMKDPAMKNMMRTSQASAIRQMYSDLVKQWALPPDEASAFYDLLLDKQSDAMDQGMAMLENSAASVKHDIASDPDAKIKASLGPDLYKQYQDYEKALGSHLAVNRLQQQLAISNAPTLTSNQSQALVQAISDVQASMPPGAASYPGTFKAGSFALDPAQVDQYMKTQGEINDKVVARLTTTLTADQLRVLTEQQQQTLAAQRMGMEMAAKMMAPSPTP